MKKISFLLSILFANSCLIAQNTVGLISYQPSKTFAGYNLIYPHNQPHVYLLNNCGEIVHTWEDEANWRPGNTAYLLPDGRLVKTKRQAAVANNPIWAGGGGAIVEIRDWDNTLLWSFERNNAQERLHHDIAITDEGNILMIVWEEKTAEEAIAAGRNPALLPQNKLWPDKVIEVDPTTDEIVWEWHVWDHLVQDFDPQVNNYGDVANSPGRININWDTSDGVPDWLHTNAIDYDPFNDQVMLSVPTFNEIWIIDHSTTTAQAATSIGGLGNKGGDLLYRWGNPAAYNQGTAADQQLFYQHDTHWIDDLLPINHPYYGKVAVFNNRAGADFSTANVFSPSFDMYNWSFPLSGNVWGPTDFNLTITHPVPTQMYSTGLSSVQFLPNGNSLIMNGRTGYAFELTPDQEIVWEYKVPLQGGQAATQGDSLMLNDNLTFRMYRYPTNYAAFTDRDLANRSWLELEPDTNFCDLILPTNDLMEDYGLKVYPNPSSGNLTVEWEVGMNIELTIVDLLGRPVYRGTPSGGRCYMSTANWHPGMYCVQINGVSVQKLVVF